MAREDFQLARQTTRRFLLEEGIENHMFHGPTSDRYWKEPTRVIMLNMESYGYDGHHEVDQGTLMDWLYDSGGVGTRTTRYSFALLTALLDRLNDDTGEVTRETLRNAYADCERLEETMDRVVYFNVNPISNARVEQNYAAIAGIGESAIGKLIWTEIQALDPQIIVVSGHAGLSALNGIAALDLPLSYRETARHPHGTLLQSISHPSRPRYNDWSKAIENMALHLSDGKVSPFSH